MKNKLTATFIAILVLFCTGVSFSETLTFGTYDWEPFYGENLPENGFFAALTREGFKRAGYEMKIEWTEWNRAVQLAKQGKYDGVVGAYINEDRKKYFVFMDPISENEEIFFQKKGAGITYSSIDEIKKYRIGALLGSAQARSLQDHGIKVETAVKDLQSIKKVYAGRIDLVLIGRINLNYLMENDPDYKPYRGTLEPVEPAYKTFKLFSPISRKRPDAQEIIKKFNVALKGMRGDGTYNKILERFDQK